MIKRITDLSDIRGTQPLMSVIQTDFCFPINDSDGVYVQLVEGEKTLVLSLRGVTANICRLSQNVDAQELVSFLNFRQVSNILSDFFFVGADLKKRAVLKASAQGENAENVTVLSSASRLGDYENVFKLLSPEGSFDAWYPAFSRKVNSSRGCGVYLTHNNIPVSCAVSPFICGEIGVVAGVFTDKNHRRKGYATICVKALLSELKNKNVKTTYLWCEDKNIKLYENIGFYVCGEIYVKKEE